MFKNTIKKRITIIAGEKKNKKLLTLKSTICNVDLMKENITKYSNLLDMQKIKIKNNLPKKKLCRKILSRKFLRYTKESNRNQDNYLC